MILWLGIYSLWRYACVLNRRCIYLTSCCDASEHLIHRIPYIFETKWLSSRCLLENLKYYQADVCWQILRTIKQSLLANLKYYQADDVTSHKRLSYLERLCLAIPCLRIVFGGDSSSAFVVDRDFPGSNPTSDNYFRFLFFRLNSA